MIAGQFGRLRPCPECGRLIEPTPTLLPDYGPDPDVHLGGAGEIDPRCPRCRDRDERDVDEDRGLQDGVATGITGVGPDPYTPDRQPTDTRSPFGEGT
jgi:hypothetical protein